MFAALLTNALERISVVEALIQAHDDYARSQPQERQALIKHYAVASCVMRLYAVYERSIETLIEDYLDGIPELIPFASLPSGLKNEYRLGISHVLGRLDAERYAHL